ncbi:SDR family NAD(P)-dependent oxidoreductase [Streptomyces sp. NPDC059582]|uniref:SDR family NAD(P)-dependent oxidoreductase n=1 Tax=Streptomyces sp. NPDC059582 TaxID=3346875 RepID=UPI0036C69478
MSKVWFVTGSSRGLGRKIVEAALEAGDRVVATARKPKQLSELAACYGDRILPVALDVSDNNDVLKAIAVGLDAYGRYDVVVNNAGYGVTASIEDATLEDFRAQIDTNFYGVVHVTKGVVPIMRRQGHGHICQISSLGGRVGSVGLSAYQSAKWAVGGFSTVLAQEVAPLGIKITVLEPGGMATDWAGSSMSIPPISQPYQQTVGEFARILPTWPMPSGPAKVADVILSLVGRQDAPLRLLIGPDAVVHAAAAAQALAASDHMWHDLSISTAVSVQAD